MSKKIYLLLILSIVMGLLGGCQLANEGEKEGAVDKEDEFVGVFITYREAGIYDELQDKIYDDREAGKIYANLVSCEEGEIVTHEYVFEGYKGIPFFHAIVKGELTGMEDYRFSSTGEGLIDSKITFKISEKEDINTGKTERYETSILEGNIYFTKDVVVYLNSVYQEEDGDVYFINESMGSMIGEGVTRNAYINRDTENVTQVDINMKKVSNIKKISYTTMSVEDEIIENNVLDIDNLPMAIELSSKVEYLLIKTEYEEGEPDINLYTKNDEVAYVLVNGNNLFIEQSMLELNWTE